MLFRRGRPEKEEPPFGRPLPHLLLQLSERSVPFVKYPRPKCLGLVETQARLDDPERFERYVKQKSPADICSHPPL